MRRRRVGGAPFVAASRCFVTTAERRMSDYLCGCGASGVNASHSVYTPAEEFPNPPKDNLATPESNFIQLQDEETHPSPMLLPPPLECTAPELHLSVSKPHLSRDPSGSLLPDGTVHSMTRVT